MNFFRFLATIGTITQGACTIRNIENVPVPGKQGVRNVCQLAICLYRKEQSSANPVNYAPVAQALCKIDGAAAAKISQKFNVA